MQAKSLTGGQELLCINTTKVYDWILNEASFDLTFIDEDLPVGLTCDDITGPVTCEVTPGITEVINREDREFVIDGVEIILQLVTLRKNFTVTFFFPTLTGIEEASFTFSRCEQVVLCAPNGTDIDVTYTDVDCFICTFDCDPGDTAIDPSFDALVTVRLCQSIQSTFPVTLEIVADFCQPRDILPTPACPAPTMPPQCPVLFPENGDDAE
ncbi:hypothetical protein [Metabacillus litoralis]|jgi:hypothetical protein|uniref:hypothetical protein n=1 Tax=Metabacillus litoralis TaxID=152268 RepID=UPI00203EB2B1|nr:hypothetical protein [Metabacillus litoralis]MCM3654505.1 hypothetical protein [Metabacillus litoralis]